MNENEQVAAALKFLAGVFQRRGEKAAKIMPILSMVAKEISSLPREDWVMIKSELNAMFEQGLSVSEE